MVPLPKKTNISKLNVESANRVEVQDLVSRCSDNNLILNTEKTKELIINFGRSQKLEYAPVFINGERVERVSSLKFLGTYISDSDYFIYCHVSIQSYFHSNSVNQFLTF